VIVQAADPVIGPYMSRAMTTIHHQESMTTVSRVAVTAQALAALRVVLIVAPPPLIWRGLRPALRGGLPVFLAPERGQVEKGPGASEGLDPASAREIRAKHPPAVAQEDTEAERLARVGGETEVDVEVAAAGGVPRHRPIHALLVTPDVRQRGARHEGQG